MNKKAITTLAMTAASMAFALIGPTRQQTKTFCLGVHEGSDGAQWADNCDHTRNNELNGATLLKNHCAEGQVSVVGVKYPGAQHFSVEVPACFPPGMVQL